MRIRSKTKLLTVAAALAAAALAAGGPVGATPEEEPESFSHLSGTTGVCGWFEERTGDGFDTVNLCGFDGVVVRDDAPEQLAEPLVIIDRYSCFIRQRPVCTSEHHEIVVDRDDFTVDPLLRRATIITATDGCSVEVEFLSTSAPRTHGGAWEYHGLSPGPVVEVAGRQTVTRTAEWWGRVCGQSLVAKEGGSDAGQADMWRGIGAGVAHYEEA